MKKKVPLCTILLSLTAIFFTDCERRSEFRWGIKVGNLTYNENAIFLGSDELSQLSEVSTNSLIFNGTKGALKSVTDNSILIISVSEKTPNGLLRKVVSIKSNGSVLEFTTVDASLPETIKEGEIKFKKVLKETEFSLKSKIDGVLAKGPEKSFDGLAVTMNELMIYEEGSKTARFNGSIGISTQIDLFIKIEASAIKEINVTSTLNKIDEVSLSATGSLSGMQEVTLAHFIHKPVVIDSLVFVPEIKINCGFDGTTISGVASGVRQDRIITSSLNFRDSKWSADPVSHSETYDFSKPQLTDNTDLKIFSGPEISINLFGVPVQIIRSAGFYSLEADKTENPFWRLFIGNEGTNNIKSTILGFSKDYSSNILIEPSEIGNGK